MFKKLLLTLFLFTPFTLAEEISVSQFSGLNNNENSVIIDNSEAQDLLNVDITPGGKSVKKRSGYGLYKSLGTGQPIHGGYHLFNSGGSDVQIWGSSTSLYGITSDASPVQLVSSATLNATWDCVDTEGSAYCVNSGRDAIIKTDGASLQGWSTAVQGTMIDLIPGRLVIAGVSGSPNTLYFSQSNSYFNFTTGINETDAFTEVITSPGAKLTHTRYACGKLLWWKNSSFGYSLGTNQFDLENVIISDTIGTTDNSSAIDPGGTIWFRGQDGHIYSYDCSSLVKESIDISPLTQASSSRISNSWTQSTQAEFQTGVSTPTPNLSFTISPGNVTLSSYTIINNSTTSWSTGYSTNVIIVGNSISLSTSNVNISNNSFDSALGSEWTSPGGGFTRVANVGTDACGTILPNDGSNFVYASGGTYGVSTVKMELLDINSNVLDIQNINGSAGCGWRTRTLLSTGNLKKRVYVKFTDSIHTLLSSPFILGGDLAVAYYVASANTGQQLLALDGILGGSSTITTGSFTSPSYDTGVSSSMFQINGFNYTINNSTPIIALQTSSNNSNWITLLTSSGTNAFGNRYVRYVSSFVVTGNESANTTLDSVTIISRSTGSYYSSIKNAPNLTSWDTFTANKQDNDGTHTFYIRSSTNSFTLTSTTPTWVSQSVGSLIAASTGTYFQFRDDFTITAATQNPTLNDFTINWFEGSASDKAYAAYFDNAIWLSVSYGMGQSLNNYIFKYDLINKGWLLYNIGSNGLLQQNSSLYFGSTLAGNIYKYGSGTSDNGTPITAYWKTKDFSGSDPWLENQYSNIDTYYRKNENQSITVSYSLNTSTTTTNYTVSLSSPTSSIIRNKKILPSGKIGGNINIKFWDTSDSGSWELLGFRIKFDQLPYRPTQ